MKKNNNALWYPDFTNWLISVWSGTQRIKIRSCPQQRCLRDVINNHLAPSLEVFRILSWFVSHTARNPTSPPLAREESWKTLNSLILWRDQQPLFSKDEWTENIMSVWIYGKEHASTYTCALFNHFKSPRSSHVKKGPQTNKQPLHQSFQWRGLLFEWQTGKQEAVD